MSGGAGGTQEADDTRAGSDNGAAATESPKVKKVGDEVAPAVDDAYREHAGRLVSFVRRQMGIHRLSDAQLDVEGVVHEAFAAAIPRWKTIDDPAAYLFTVVRNMIGRAAPRAAQVRAVEVVALDQAAAVYVSTLAPRADPEDVHLAREVVTEMGRLPAQQSKAMYLRHVQGWTYGEIADLLGCTSGAVGAHISKGKAKILVHHGRSLVSLIVAGALVAGLAVVVFRVVASVPEEVLTHAPLLATHAVLEVAARVKKARVEKQHRQDD